MTDEGDPVHRSGCPINLAAEVMGDRWSLVVLRDVMGLDLELALASSLLGVITTCRARLAAGRLWRRAHEVRETTP
jgi:hypothetical protein